MFRRLILAAAIACFAAVGPAAAQQTGGRVTLVLQSGEKVMGLLAQYDNTTIDIRDNSGRRSFPMADAAVVDFVGTASNLPATEVNQAAEQAPYVVLRNGSTYRGSIVDFEREGGPDERLIFDASPGGRQVWPLRDVARLYVRALSPSARNAVGAPAATPAPAPTPPVTPAAPNQRVVNVPGNVRWVDTGIVVSQGDRLDLVVEGTVYLQPGQGEPAGPSGAHSGLRTATGPLPGQAAGALIGRIGEFGAAFGIGGQPSLTMPAAGRLYLGVNDGEPDDNSGQFTVRLTHEGGGSVAPRRRR